MNKLTLTQRLNGQFAIANLAFLVISITESGQWLAAVVLGLVMQVFGYWTSKSIVRHLAATAAQLQASVQTLQETSSSIENSSTDSANQAQAVTILSNEMNAGVTTVAAAVDQMHASIGEISRSASEATRVASEAVQTVKLTNDTVSQLGESSAQIGKVIEVITSIAEQTNLLALNATIEAARAGEAGKGFAVVANEVKELAKGTAEATEEISRRIAAIQTDTTGAVSAIDQIGLVVSQINDIQSTIASAVEEQTATTTEIARSIQEAAGASSNMNSSIEAFAGTAQHAAEGASANRAVVAALREVMHDLNTLSGYTGAPTTEAQRAADIAAAAHQAKPRRDLVDAPAPRDIVDWADEETLAAHGAPATNGKYRLN